MPLSQLEDLVKNRQFATASRVFLELMRHTSLTKNELGRAYHCASICRYHLGDYFSAQKLAMLAEQYAGRRRDPVLLGRTWINLVAICRDIGDTAMALEYGDKWLANKVMYPELVNHEARVHYNLGRVHRSRRDYERSLQHFRSAVDLAMGSGLSISFRTMAIQMLAWSLYLQDRFDEGDKYLDMAATLIEEDDEEGAREQLLLMCLRAYLTGDSQRAMELVEEFLNPAAKNTLDQKFWATWMLGNLACSFGQYEWGQAVGFAARDLALKTRESEHLAKAGDLIRRATEGIQRKESAG